MPALGVALRVPPALFFDLVRTSSRSVSCTRSTVPSSRQAAKYRYTVCHGGKSVGSMRHEQPLRVTYKTALTIRGTLRKLPAHYRHLHG